MPAARVLEPAGRVSETAVRAAETSGKVSETARTATELAERALEPNEKALEITGRALEPAGRPGATLEGQLGGLRGNAGKKKRMEHSWYAVVPQVIVPYGATAQKQEKQQQ